MNTIFDPAARATILDRAGRLTPESRAAWGKMSVGQMVCHLNESLRMATGELQCRPKGGPLSFPPLRWLIINLLPFPRGAPTAPELLAGTPAAELATDRARFGELLEQVAAIGENGDYPAHPAFGRMRGRQWGILIYRHMDHHLRQFGV